MQHAQNAAIDPFFDPGNPFIQAAVSDEPSAANSRMSNGMQRATARSPTYWLTPPPPPRMLPISPAATAAVGVLPRFVGPDCTPAPTLGPRQPMQTPRRQQRSYVRESPVTPCPIAGTKRRDLPSYDQLPEVAVSAEFLRHETCRITREPLQKFHQPIAIVVGKILHCFDYESFSAWLLTNPGVYDRSGQNFINPANGVSTPLQQLRRVVLLTCHATSHH